MAICINTETISEDNRVKLIHRDNTKTITILNTIRPTQCVVLTVDQFTTLLVIGKELYNNIHKIKS